MGLEHFTREAAENLEALTAQTSPIGPGRYVVRHSVEATARAQNDQVESTLWFRTPPLTSDTIRKLTGVRLFAESHDQGHVGDRSQGNWTWFELAIYKDEEATEPRSVNDLQLAEFYYENRFDEGTYAWMNGRAFEKRKENLLNLLEEGNTLGVRICARFRGWSISAKNGYLVLEIGKGVSEQKHVPMKQLEQLAREIKRIDITIQEVNNYTDASFKPAVPESIYNVDEMDRGRGEAPLRVLCLDGGGVRGLASLHLLRAVMGKYDPSGTVRPCEVFDLIGGASTGGLIAIMLGCLKMTIDECIRAYLDIMGKVFGSQKNGGALRASRYPVEPLEAEIKRLIVKKREDKNENAKLFDEESRCKVYRFVLSVDRDAPNNRGPVFLRSYNNRFAQSEEPGIQIWQAARATSAAPAYFDALAINGRNLIDGGLAANNPLGWLWTEIVGVYGPAQLTQCFLSIGTGIPSRVPLPDHLAIHPWNGMYALSGIATNTEVVHLLFRTLIDALAPQAGHGKYWRLNISKQIMKRVSGFLGFGQGEVEVKLDDSDEAAQKAMIEAANEYIQAESQMIRKCAEALKL